MKSFEIIQQKLFMNKLLKTNLFDSFAVHEITVSTAFKLTIDGKRNQAYFKDFMTNSDFLESEYLSWSELRPLIYSLMQGKHLPTFFKIVLSTHMPNQEKLYPNVTNFYLTISLKEKQLICQTGVAYSTFTLDQSAQQAWDERIKEFLLKYEFIE